MSTRELIKSQPNFDARIRPDFLDHPQESRAELYHALNQLLETGENDRLLLYLPLDLIPDTKDYRHYGQETDTFLEHCYDIFYRLLTEYDVAANFIDGDVPDIELGVEGIQMAVQAAYLVPQLEHKGIISRDQLNTTDPILKHSLKQATANRIIAPPAPWQPDKISEALQEKEYSHVSKKRAKWLNWEHRRRTISEFAYSLGIHVASGSPAPVVDAPTSDFAEIVAHGLGRAIELNPSLYEKHCEHILELRDDQDITGIFCRFRDLDIVDDEELERLDIRNPFLSGPIHENVADLPERAAINELLHHPEVAKIIHPITIVYGSRLKGYGGPNADLDLAVFVKAAVQKNYMMIDWEYQRGSVERTLHKVFGQNVTQYWLNKDGTIVDDNRLSPFAGTSLDAHVLLTGAWEGDPKAITRVRKPILNFYRSEKRPEVRRIWLREMERDLLQYRLLHRGYETYRYVPRGMLTFFDPGYRRTATELYGRYVRLP